MERFSLSVFLSALALVSPSFAAESDKIPVEFEADDLRYDRNAREVTATGNVEISQGDYVLVADRVRYLQQEDEVFAEGNVSVLEPSGHVYFAEEVELQNELKTGAVEAFKARLVDGSRLAAVRGQKVSEYVTKLFKAVYSPCNVTHCETGEPKTPFWQVKASEVTVDDQSQRIAYEDVKVELFGVPVFYSPYFSHATPGAKRKSGFLTTSFKQESNLGTTLKLPYYVDIAPDKDATITPFLTSAEGPVVIGQYRQIYDNGYLQFEGSATNPERRDEVGAKTSGNKFRGHLFGEGNFRVDDVWRWGFEIEHSSDDTYLGRYGFRDEDTLTSQLFAQAVDGRNFLDARSILFQGTHAEDDPGLTPVAAPYITGRYETTPNYYGGKLYADGSLLSLTRSDGSDSHRFSLAGGWKRMFSSDDGQLIEVDAELRADAYAVDGVTLSNGDNFDGSTGRFRPQVAVTWSLPAIKYLENANLIVEPIGQVVASPNGGNPDKISNEDSLSNQLSVFNLFDPNRFTGRDLVESGTRVNYGMRGQYHWHQGGYVNWIVGQSFLGDNNGLFPLSQDAGSNFSDIVAGVALDYKPVNLSYGLQLDQETLNTRRNEFNGSFTYNPVSFYTTYNSLDSSLSTDGFEEVQAGGSLKLDDNWTLTSYATRDLTEWGGWVNNGAGLTYANECITVISNVGRSFTRDRDIKPSTSFTLQVLLRNF